MRALSMLKQVPNGGEDRKDALYILNLVSKHEADSYPSRPQIVAGNARNVLK